MSKGKVAPKDHLYEAIRNGDMGKVKKWANKVSKSKKFPLHWGDENMKLYNRRWWNWIHYAVYFNQLEIVKYFVEVIKIDINIRTILIVSRSKYYNDDTSLHIAVREGFIPIVQYLLEKHKEGD